MLTQAPATVRTTAFAQSIYHWYGTDQHAAPPYPTPTNTPRVPVKGTPTMDETAPGAAVHGRGTLYGYPGAGLGYPDFVAQIETAYGGIFYLINLALFLNLYGDFTTPLQPGIALPIWDFVALLGQQMLGEHIVADPVWPLLAQLTGRFVEEAPDRYFEPPEHWRIPPAWLNAFPEEAAWHWSIENGRLRVLHPAQFLLLDVPLDTNNPTEQLRHELNSYANVYSQSMPPLHYEPSSLLTDAMLLPCGRVAVNNLD
ncbi:MAG TPA: hypothetical protein VGN15_11755, partial [Ktedonobacteraceae bacterium]|nr:hypothetical protein [Ktedonobacteraceae bacterium]